MQVQTSEQEGYLLSLGKQDVVNPTLLGEPAKEHLGGDADIDLDDIQIRIGSRPRVMDLRRLYEHTGRQLPAEYQVAFNGANLWLIIYSMSVVNLGRKRVDLLHFDVTLPARPWVTVEDVFPKPKFVTPVKIESNGGFEASAGIDLSGKFGLPPEATELFNQEEYISGAGNSFLRLKLGGKTAIVGKASIEVKTRVVEAMGCGDVWSKWAFFRDDEPLLNDFVMAQTVSVPTVTKKLVVKAGVGATVSTYGLRRLKRSAAPIELEVRLPADAGL